MVQAEVHRSFITTTVRDHNSKSHHNLKGATGSKVRKATNGIQFYAIANLDKTSLHTCIYMSYRLLHNIIRNHVIQHCHIW